MRCDNCGCEIPEGQQILSTRSEQNDPPGYTGAHTATEAIWLCRSCAEKRRRLGVFAWLVVMAFLIFVVFLWILGR